VVNPFSRNYSVFTAGIGMSPELAEHFSQSGESADLAKAISYGETAAQRAASVYAYGEAVRLLEQALKVQRVLDPEDKPKVYDLLLAPSEALTIAGDAHPLGHS
jgi:hypothetical protein